MKIMSPPHLLSLCALLSLFAPGARGALGARQPAAEAARAELLRRLNEERRAAGAPPLVLQPQLTAAAQEHAEELSRRGDISNRRGASEEMDERLHRLGYRAAEWGEGVYATTEDIGAVVSGLRERDGDTWRRLMDPGYRDVGIGVSGLRDISRVRAEMLEAVAEVRRKAGLQPLTPDPRLDRAAQGHAEDMLARSYFAHQSPEGKTVRQRATEAGYPWRMIGENIAEGQYTVAEVMDSWMKSRPHRANLLERGFTQLGTGLAFGRDPKTGDYRTVWVQVFGTPK